MIKASSVFQRVLALTFLWVSLLSPSLYQDEDVMLLRKSLELSSFRQLPSGREGRLWKLRYLAV